MSWRERTARSLSFTPSRGVVKPGGGEVLGLARLRVQKSEAVSLFAASEDGERAVQAVEGSSRSRISPNR